MLSLENYHSVIERLPIYPSIPSPLSSSFVHPFMHPPTHPNSIDAVSDPGPLFGYTKVNIVGVNLAFPCKQEGSGVTAVSVNISPLISPYILHFLIY